jgi:uncharacterized protein (TIGR02246 family)
MVMVTQDVVQGIAATYEQFIQALRRGDAVECAGVYPNDGIILPPNAPMQRGKQAIQEFFQALIDMGIRDATLETVELDTHGDTAIEIGRYTLRTQAAAGQPADTGKYMVVWRRQPKGPWKVSWDMFSSDPRRQANRPLESAPLFSQVDTR